MWELWAVTWLSANASAELQKVLGSQNCLSFYFSPFVYLHYSVVFTCSQVGVKDAHWLMWFIMCGCCVFLYPCSQDQGIHFPMSFSGAPLTVISYSLL